MRTYHTYSVQFDYGNGLEPQIRKYQAANVGHAQKKCLREYPGTRVIEIQREGLYGEGLTVYQPASTARVEPLPAVKTEEQTFAFFDECKEERPRRLP
jgi:hypothetical protein